MNLPKPWTSPVLTPYGSVEQITENRVGTVTKNGGSGDTISVTVNGVPSVVATGAAAGSSLVNITPDANFNGPC